MILPSWLLIVCCTRICPSHSTVSMTKYRLWRSHQRTFSGLPHPSRSWSKRLRSLLSSSLSPLPSTSFPFTLSKTMSNQIHQPSSLISKINLSSTHYEGERLTSDTTNPSPIFLDPKETLQKLPLPRHSLMNPSQHITDISRWIMRMQLYRTR